MLANPFRLRELGVLGINRRNTHFVADGNPRHLMPLVNDKMKTKELAQRAGVAVPRLYGVIEVQAQVRRLDEMLGGRDSFVIKPASGAQGDGILVVAGRNRKGRRLASGKVIDEATVAHHISNVLSGMYSLNGLQDVAMLEETVRFADVFKSVAEIGVPDIRIIIYRGVPAMAMARVPTRESDGKANLHKGGIGLGISLSEGITTTGVYHDSIISEHPETGAPLAGIRIDAWQDILNMSARCYEPTGLNYLGVDIVIDVDRGPLLLELNARPGLAVQLANGSGLRARLEAIDARYRRGASPEERVAYAMEADSATPRVA